MKNDWMLATLLIALFCFALPALADDAVEADPLPEEDTIIGMWHVQMMGGEVLPADEKVRISFQDDGVVKVFEGDREDVEVASYSHDKQKALITIYEQDDPADIEAVVKYSFVDDMLIMRITEGPARQEEDEQIIELTRNPEGAERHQAMRKERGDKPSPKQQMQRVRQLHMAVLTYSVDNGKTPASIGETVVDGYITLEGALSATTMKELPEGFADLEKQAKVDWINKHLGCVYIQPANFDAIDANQLVVFELPTEEDQEVAAAFGDGHSKLLDAESADKQIVKATGQTIAAWKKSKSPGSGAVPEKDAAEEKDKPGPDRE